MATSFEEPKRFWSKVDVGEADECWEWQAYKGGQDYGRFEIHYKVWRAHRVSWVLTYGPIPEGLRVLHHCDNPSCVNPYHLFLGTQKDNMVDAVRKDRLPLQELAKKEVLEILELYDTGEWSRRELAEEFGVGKGAIGRIVRGERWSWLKSKEA